MFCHIKQIANLFEFEIENINNQYFHRQFSSWHNYKNQLTLASGYLANVHKTEIKCTINHNYYIYEILRESREERGKQTIIYWKLILGLPGGAVVKNLPAKAGDMSSTPGLGRSHMPQSNEARASQLLSLRTTTTEPACLEPVLHKRSHCNERPVHRNQE